MRHRAKQIIAIALAALAGACAPPLRIPDGTYGDGRGGTVEVEGERIAFRVPATDPRVRTAGTSCGYRLKPDGSLLMSGSSNSSYYVFFVIAHDWRWTGAALEGRDRRDGTLVTYTPVP
jgi:hypothetical protein